MMTSAVFDRAGLSELYFHIIYHLKSSPTSLSHTCAHREVTMATEPEGPVNQSGLI